VTDPAPLASRKVRAKAAAKPLPVGRILGDFAMRKEQGNKTEYCKHPRRWLKAKANKRIRLHAKKVVRRDTE
jgi:hypothetical protein